MGQTGRTLSESKIIPICGFSRGGLNVRLDARTFKPCSEVTDRDYFTFRKLTVAAGVILMEGFWLCFFALERFGQKGMKRGEKLFAVEWVG